MDKVKEVVLKIWLPVKAKVSSMDRKLKIGIVAGLAVVIVSLIALGIIFGQTGYAVLLTGTSTTERAEIITYIQETVGVAEVRVNAAGDILVPEEQVESIRVKLSIAGYPKSAFNYDIWNSSVSFLSTESEKLEVKRQQTESNLRATLQEFEGVTAATVNLVIPENSTYVISTSEIESSASVVLQLSQELDSEQIQGMYNLIAASVPGLKEENIAISDGTGRPLIVIPDGSSESEEEQARLKLYYQRRAFETQMREDLEKGLQDLFAGTFENYSVEVALRLNYDDQVTEKTEYSGAVPDDGTSGGMIDEETYSGAAGGVAQEGGLVGTTIDADISQDYPTIEVGEDGEFYYEQSKTIHRLVNETKTQIQKNGYSIENLSAGVVVQADTMTTADEEKWRSVIAAAIGTSIENVQITAQPGILTSDPGIDTAPLSTTSSNNAILLAVIIVLGVVLVVLLVLAMTASGSKKKRVVVKGKLATANGAPTGRELGGSGEYDPFEMSPASATARAVANAEEDFELHSLNDDTPETRDGALKREIRDFSKTNPEIVAQLIRTWLRNEE